MECNDNEILKKLDYFLKTKQKIHVTKNNRNFYNGFVLERLSDEVFLFRDDIFGKIELFVFEIFEVRNYNNGNGGSRND